MPKPLELARMHTFMNKHCVEITLVALDEDAIPQTQSNRRARRKAKAFNGPKEPVRTGKRHTIHEQDANRAGIPDTRTQGIRAFFRRQLPTVSETAPLKAPSPQNQWG